MIHIDSLTLWALSILISVVLGTFALIAVAFIRRWQQVRYARYVHELQRRYRPIMAKLLRGEQRPTGIEALRELPLAEREILLDPLLSRRKLSERQSVFLQALCADLGLIALWQSRLANGRKTAIACPAKEEQPVCHDRALVRHLLRAKSIRNLGKLRHQPSWQLLMEAVQDRHRDIQSVALRSLAALGAVESFPVLCRQLHAAIEGGFPSPLLPGLQAAMVSFDLRCASVLAPSLHHPDDRLRVCAVEVLRTMVCREAAAQPDLTLTPELLAPEVADSLLNGLTVDPCAEVRARTADMIVFLADHRVGFALHRLLSDDEWFVRLRTVRALTQLRHAAAPIHLDVRERLRDPHWRVREAACLALISLGSSGKRQLYEHFLTSADHDGRAQIVEVVERTGLISTLVKDYSDGSRGLDALMVEQLASEAAPLGLAGILRTLPPEIQQKFRERFLPYVEAHRHFLKATSPPEGSTVLLQPALPFPPALAA